MGTTPAIEARLIDSMAKSVAKAHAPGRPAARPESASDALVVRRGTEANRRTYASRKPLSGASGGNDTRRREWISGRIPHASAASRR
jgi:hypothetical protein